MVGKMSHIGVVAKDLDLAIEQLGNLLGPEVKGPWFMIGPIALFG